jgi:hypothetical protein
VKENEDLACRSKEGRKIKSIDEFLFLYLNVGKKRKKKKKKKRTSKLEEKKLCSSVLRKKREKNKNKKLSSC